MSPPGLPRGSHRSRAASPAGRAGGAKLRVVIRADLAEIPAVRHACWHWCHRQGLRESDCGDIELILSELVANAEKASPPRDPPTLRVVTRTRALGLKSRGFRLSEGLRR